MLSGAQKINPNVEILVWDVNGFDNVTNQEAAANDLIDKGCDILTTVCAQFAQENRLLQSLIHTLIDMTHTRT